MIEQYRAKQWSAWKQTLRPMMTDIPVAKAQLQGRVADSYFDGGRTAAWLSTLEGSRHATWRAVRDARTGHTIHCVSDRAWDDLTADLHLGLRLMSWMSVRPVVWYWWDQEWLRELPAETVPTREHINGGWATPGVLEVHVYRREETHKVLLHEMIHALDLDVSRTAAAAVRERLNADVGRELWIHLGEAYTELFAEWLWAIAQSASIVDARVRWSAQVACATRQAAEVWVRVRSVREPEDTNVFAYYVLKWVLMQHLPDALLRKEHGVENWVAWWEAARPVLDAMSERAAESLGRAVRLGMTCVVT